MTVSFSSFLLNDTYILVLFLLLLISIIYCCFYFSSRSTCSASSPRHCQVADGWAKACQPKCSCSIHTWRLAARCIRHGQGIFWNELSRTYLAPLQDRGACTSSWALRGTARLALCVAHSFFIAWFSYLTHHKSELVRQNSKIIVTYLN